MEEENIEEILRTMKRFMSVRERCESEIIQYMRKKGLGGGIEREVISALKRNGLLDELRFAQNRIEFRIHRGYGPLYIKNELKSLKISDAVISESISSVSRDEFLELAVQILEQKLPGLIAHEDAEKKLYGILKYRGFPDTLFRPALDAVRKKFPHWGLKRGEKTVID